VLYLFLREEGRGEVTIKNRTFIWFYSLKTPIYLFKNLNSSEFEKRNYDYPEEIKKAIINFSRQLFKNDRYERLISYHVID